MPSRLAAGVVALIISVTLGACAAEGDDGPDAAPSKPPSSAPATATPPPDPTGERYESIDDLAAAMEAGGIPCTDLQYLEQEEPSLEEFALCDPDGDALQRLDIYLFETTKNRDRWMGSIVQSGLPWVFGPNWIIVTGGEPATADERTRLVQEAIGGRIAEIQL